MGFSRRKRTNRQINGSTMIVPGSDPNLSMGGIKNFNVNITKNRFTGQPPQPEYEQPKINPYGPLPTPSASYVPPLPTPTPSITTTITSTPTTTPTPTSTPLFATVNMRYSTSGYSQTCDELPNTYYIEYSTNLVYIDNPLTTLAPLGYYVTDNIPCVDQFGYYGYSISLNPGVINGTIFFNPCPNASIATRYDQNSLSAICSNPLIQLRTSGTSTPEVGKIYYSSVTPTCIIAPDGYYSRCLCPTTGYDYFIISGGTGEVVYVELCSTPTPTPTLTQTPTPSVT